MKNGIVIPCYNEADRLDFDAFQDFIDYNPEYVLCFVNDGSSDATLAQLEAFQLCQPQRVLVNNMEKNGGKAEAVRQGVQCLLRNTAVLNIGFIDADLATGFDDYKRLVNVLKFTGKNMVFGSRKMQSIEDIDRSAFRKLASNGIGSMIRFVIGMPVKDTQCGAKVFTRLTADYLFNPSFLSRWLFDVEIFLRMKNLYGNKVMDKVEEVGLIAWEEVEGSKITLIDSIRFPTKLLEIGFDYKIRPQLRMINSMMRRGYSLGAFNKSA